MSQIQRISFFLVGTVLLLPGLCTLWFIGSEIEWFWRTGSQLWSNDLSFTVLWGVCLAISVGGGLLIRKAMRARRAESE